jgi:signal transduction histidine kinase
MNEGSVIGRLLQWIDSCAADQGLVQKARIRAQHVTGLAALALGIPYSAFFQVMGVRWSMPLLIPLCATMVVTVLRLTRRQRWVSGARIISASTFLFIALALVARGGMFSNSAAWLLVAPMFSTFVAGPRLGVLTAVATALTYGLLWVAPELGFELPPPLPPAVLRWMPLVDYPLMALLMGGILAVQAGLWERAEREALDAAHARYTFLATMSHEIRTPLNGVLGITELLLDTSLSAEQRELASTVQRSGTLLRSVLDDVLDYSKIDSGHLEAESLAVDLNVLCRDLARLWEGSARERGLELVVDFAPDAPRWVKVDPNKFKQILGNLVSNALKFTPHGGVYLEVPAAVDDRLLVRVRDTGIGMSPAQLERIFRPFVQGDHSTTRRFGGTGLGLSICQRLARFLGGEVSVISMPGAGSTFTLSLPLVPAEALADAKTDSTEAIDLKGLRVLVAEDNAVNRLVICRLLEKLGIEVRTAAEGENCVQQWKAHPIDLILMDCQMPGCDGYQATRRIRQEGGTLPIIALTANAMADDRARCLEAGMNDHMSKPIDPSVLVSVLRTWRRAQ